MGKPKDWGNWAPAHCPVCKTELQDFYTFNMGTCYLVCPVCRPTELGMGDLVVYMPVAWSRGEQDGRPFFTISRMDTWHPSTR